jgi:hypothetical protein
VELTTTNGHKQNSGDESDEETQTEQATIPAAAAGVVSGDETKPIDPNEPDPINRRRLFLRLLNNNIFFCIRLARPMAERTPNPVFEVVPDDVLQVKIADLGNACWTVGLTEYYSHLILVIFSINILQKIFKHDNIVH